MKKRGNPLLKKYKQKRKSLKALKIIETRSRKYDELKCAEEFNNHHNKYMAKEWCPFHGHTFVDGVCLACGITEFKSCTQTLRRE